MRDVFFDVLMARGRLDTVAAETNGSSELLVHVCYVVKCQTGDVPEACVPEACEVLDMCIF